jgi:radical SAM enzyme (rSAM/lipoprotein system)
MSALREKGRAGRWLHRRLLPLHQAGQRRIHDLNYLFFELTQRCNLECRHCGSDCSSDSSLPDLSHDQVLDVLRGVSKQHDPAGITVALTGGEPLLYPDFFGLGRAITELGFPWGMVTNGYAWSPEKVAAAREAGMRTITVSLDGPPEVHDWLRGRKGSYARAAEALRMLSDATWIQQMDVVTCVHRRNLDLLDETRAILGDLGVRKWRLFTVSPIGRAAEEPDLILDKDRFRRLLAWVEAARRTAGPAVTYSESGYLGACDTTVRSHPFFCRAGVNVAGIMADGAILACPNIDRSFAQGNIATDDFCEVWETGYKPFRDRAWLRTGECADCREWSVCQGNSFHLVDPETRHTRLCYVKEFGLET